MGTQATPLGLRLFLEGVEVPVISAQVSIQPNQPASAAIQIVPTDQALNFLPRTLVHLFSLDEALGEEDIKLANAQDESGIPTPQVFDIGDDRYKILFTGEVIGYNYQKDPNSRSFVLQCLDLSSYWDTCYQWFADYSPGSGGAIFDQEHTFLGAKEGLLDNVTSGTTWVLGELIMSPPENLDYKNMKGLLGGLIHVLEAVGGLRPRLEAQFPGYRGANDFFTIAELRYHLTGMIGAVEKDNTSTQLYNNKAFATWLKNGMSSLGNLISFRDIMNQIGRWIFHDVYPNPAARFVKGDEGKTTRTFNTHYTTTDAGKKAKAKAKEALDAFESAQSKIEIASSKQAARAEFVEPFADIDNGIELLQASLSELAKIKSSSASEARLQVEAALRSVSAFIIDERRKIDDISRLDLSLLLTTIQFLRTLINEDPTAIKSVQYNVQLGRHLYNQLFLPETFFCSPPKCNVIFPDQYFQLSYSRNFMREVSRLAMRAGMGMFGGNGGVARILGDVYLAPRIVDTENKLVNATWGLGSRILLPHEVHSGIIPKVEWVPDGHRWAIKAANEDGRNYLQRIANFQFFLQRWEARTMNISMRFNPRLVIGFPAVVLDRSTPNMAVLQAVAETLGGDRSILPTAFLGKMTSLVHNVSQGGGTTQAALTHCRTHRGLDDDFLGVLSRENVPTALLNLTVVSKNVFSPSNKDQNKFLILQRFLTKTLNNSELPGWGMVSKVDASTPEVILSEAETNKLDLPLDVLKERNTLNSDTGIFMIRVPATIKVQGRATLTAGKFALLGNKTIPPELLLMPRWYADSWGPEKISKDVYRPLLACDALTDDSQINTDESFIKLMRILMEKTEDKFADDTAQAEVTLRDGLIKFDDKGRVVEFRLGKGGIEKSIDGLNMLYAIYKKRGANVQRFINDFTFRPVATLPQVLGSRNLVIKDDGSLQDPETMTEGFHSRAFGDYNTQVSYSAPDAEGNITATAGEGALKHLLNDQERAGLTKSLLGKRAIKEAIPKHLDPRGRARQRVVAYMKELQLSRGLLGS